jgi:hypothetical protein
VHGNSGTLKSKQDALVAAGAEVFTSIDGLVRRVQDRSLA